MVGKRQAASGKKAASVVGGSAPPARQPLAVILLDLDGTIVGPVDRLLDEYMAHNALRSGAAHVDPPAHVVDAMVERLRLGVMRPGFHRFVRLCASKPATELFVYTAGLPHWATFMVGLVERAVNRELRRPEGTQVFRRPLLTRDHCVTDANGALRKSLDAVVPLVCRALRTSGYPRLAHGDLRHSVLMVDNTPGILVDRPEKLVLCPTYGFAHAYDALASVPPAALQAHPVKIGSAIGFRHAAPRYDSAELTSSYYRLLIAASSAERLAANRAALRDAFWKRLGRAVAPLLVLEQPFTADRVRSLNRGVAILKSKSTVMRHLETQQ